MSIKHLSYLIKALCSILVCRPKCCDVGWRNAVTSFKQGHRNSSSDESETCLMFVSKANGIRYTNTPTVKYCETLCDNPLQGGAQTFSCLTSHLIKSASAWKEGQLLSERKILARLDGKVDKDRAMCGGGSNGRAVIMNLKQPV